MAAPEEALEQLARSLREDDTLLAGHLREPSAAPGLGLLAAAGQRAAGAEADYAFVIEAVREGYLLHYGEPRITEPLEPDLALLAGDHLYALGLECLAGLGDLEAVRELADLISLCARIHEDGEGDPATAAALWLAAVAAVAAGPGGSHEAAKAALRSDGPGEDAAAALAAAAQETASAAGIDDALDRAADAIDFSFPDPPASG